MVPPTVTVKVKEALLYAQQRAAKVGRTQQLEIVEGLFIRIAAGGRKFLLFQLEGEPALETAEVIAQALQLQQPSYGWHQGETLRSLTVVEQILTEQAPTEQTPTEQTMSSAQTPPALKEWP